MNINDGASHHLPLLGFATFLTYTSLAIGSIVAAQQSFTFQVPGWTHNELIGWGFVWILFTLMHLKILSETITNMLDVNVCDVD